MRDAVTLSAITLLLQGTPACDDGEETGDSDAAAETGTVRGEAGDTLAAARVLEFDANGAASHSDAIDPAGDRDVYFVRPPVGTMTVAWVAACIHDGDLVPDAVLRLYDSAGVLLAEIDDFPYWSWGTDPGLFWQATDPDGYYLEILEWSDWAPESTGPEGGPEYGYEVLVRQDDLSTYEWCSNQTMEEADACWDESRASLTDDLALYFWWFDEVLEGRPETNQAFGEVEAPGDEDWWPRGFGVGYEGYVQVSFWDEFVGLLDPILSVYDEHGNLLGQTRTPALAYSPAFGSHVWSVDPGIVFRVHREGWGNPNVGWYYLVVEDAAGNGDAGGGYFYALLDSGVWILTGGDPWEVEPNDPIEEAAPLDVQESISEENGACTYALFAGALDTPDDALDAFRLDSATAGDLEGRYLNVYVETVLHGSLLDAVVTVWADAGDGSFTELTSAAASPSGASEDDPAVWDLRLEGDESLVVGVESETGPTENDVARFYYAAVEVYDVPFHASPSRRGGSP